MLPVAFPKVCKVEERLGYFFIEPVIIEGGVHRDGFLNNMLAQFEKHFCCCFIIMLRLFDANTRG